LAEWIRGRRGLKACPAETRVVGRDELPALLRGVMAGCATAACHGRTAFPRLADPAQRGAERVDVEGLALSVSRFVPSRCRLVPRIASGLFPAKPQNRRAHGGGRRLGAVEDDCAMAAIAAWMNGTAPGVCRPRPLPDRERFAKVVQPSLEALTCPRCHVDEA